MSKLTAVIKQFEQALKRLDEVLAAPQSDIVRDSAIQRFEFTLDLAWKSVKAFLEEKKGLVCASPKDCFREAYKQGLVDYDEVWVDLVDLRNESAHTYKEEIAEEIYAKLPQTLERFKELLVVLKK